MRAGAASKPVLVLQLRPQDGVSDSEYQAILRYGGLDPDAVTRVRLDREPFPEGVLDRFSAVIVGGSPFEVSTPPDLKSPLQKEIEAGFRALFDELVPADFPFLGACSGNGLLGAWCGAVLSGRFSEPVGGSDVSLTDAAADDPLLKGLPPRFRVLLGHKEACDDVPPGAVLLATSEACPVQMFRVGSNVYATQFHPEGDPEGFALRIEVYRHHGYFPAERARELLEAVQGEHTPEAHAILARFVERYAPHAAVPRTGRPSIRPRAEEGPPSETSASD